jgi:hypothetical protein
MRGFPAHASSTAIARANNTLESGCLAPFAWRRYHTINHRSAIIWSAMSISSQAKTDPRFSKRAALGGQLGRDSFRAFWQQSVPFNSSPDGAGIFQELSHVVRRPHRKHSKVELFGAKERNEPTAHMHSCVCGMSNMRDWFAFLVSLRRP